jgi:hypothetical protein
MHRSVRAASALAGLAVLAGTCAAQPSQTSQPPAAPPAADTPTEVKGVTVTASRRRAMTNLSRAVDRFAASHGAPARKSEQLARWETPMCIATVGLDPAYNAFITDRIRAVAAVVGAPVEPPGRKCDPNVEIFFSETPQELALRAFKRNDELMGFHHQAEVARFRRFEPPIKAWYMTGTNGVVDSQWSLSPVANGATDTQWSLTPGGNGGIKSRIQTHDRSIFMNVLVIADTEKVIGYEIGPVADYMAALVLAQPRSLTECDSLPSILDLMSPNCADSDKPRALTDADLAYLKALYRVSPEQKANLARDEIAAQMRRDLAPRQK